MEVGTTTNNLTARLPILNPGDYDLWLMRIQQYFLMTDYSLWEIIKNGNKELRRTVGTVEQEYEPITTEEKHDRINEMKARATLLMALPNKDQLKFHSYQDAKLLMEAIEKRYGGNKESKKVHKTLLKQQYENFAALSLEIMDQTFDRLQKLISQLEIQGEVEIETISLDDLYNNLKIYEPEITGSSSTSQNSQNVAFVSNSTNNTNITNKADDTAHGVSTTHTQEDLEQLHPDDLEEMDLQWEMVILTIRARRFIKRTGKKLDINVQRVDFDKSKVECFNCHKHGHFARECSYQAEEEQPTNHVLMAFTSSEISSRSDSKVDSYSKTRVKAYATLKEQYDSFSSDYKKSQFNLVSYKAGYDTATAASPAVESFVNLTDKIGSDKGYHSVPPSLIGNFISRKPDLTFLDEIGNPQQKEYKEKGVIDSSCSRHMTRNKCYLDEYEDYDGGFVSFGDGKGRISGKGKIKTGSLDFDDVYFCKELKYNLFSMSQICDKKNNVLFTDTECLVLSSNFKLLDECQVLLRVPRKDNIYSVDLKSVVPIGGLTCLTAKAIIDESNTWHRRLRHINFKTMNKLVKGNLVKGLPLKIFENYHSCVACQKGKQHKASYKTKLVNSIRKSLHMLHMDLFGPTNVKSLMKKSYFLVVSDDFSRFSWVFILTTKDETSRILKTFIIEIENQLDHKVKVIRSENRTEFNNSIMNQFCEMKRIKREFSVARTPQQNGVAERKNRTLIEAARTMLVDFKFPTTFWAEAVNTSCYVLNRVLVIKPHNKTPYELIRGRPPLIDFMKPFGYLVTILNIRDHLGKFNGKADEGYFGGYFLFSKPMRVFNKRTRIVKETLNIRFLENTSNVKGNGPDWLFDVDSLSISMNYVPVFTGNKTNSITGTKDNIVAGPKDCEGVVGMKPTELDENEASDKSGKHDQEARSESERLNQREMQIEHTNSSNGINTINTPVSTVGPSFDTAVPSTPINTAGPSVSTANETEEQLFERFSPFKNAFTLPPVPNIS
ncbi:putative ribonuclease H-like domain-containing protein [Tanacetum coccineum]